MAIDGATAILVDRLAELGRSGSLGRGEVLFRQGDRATDVFAVEQGRLRLERNLESGAAVTLSVIRAPALLAEASIFGERYHCRAIAEVACRVTRAPKADVLRLLERDPSFSRAMIRALASEVKDLRGRLELRNVRPASERVLQFLRLRADQGLPPYDRPLAAMASELGLTPEALYRAAGRLERAGEVTRRGGRLVLAEP